MSVRGAIAWRAHVKVLQRDEFASVSFAPLPFDVSPSPIPLRQNDLHLLNEA